MLENATKMFDEFMYQINISISLTGRVRLFDKKVI